MVPLCFNGDVGALCQSLAAVAADDSPRREVAVLELREPSGAQGASVLQHLPDFTRVARIVAFPVVCCITAPALSAVDVLVALACDAVQAEQPRVRAEPPEGDLGVRLLREARRRWEIFTGDAAEEGVWDLGKLSPLPPACLEQLTAFPPHFWMGFRYVGLHDGELAWDWGATDACLSATDSTASSPRAGAPRSSSGSQASDSSPLASDSAASSLQALAPRSSSGSPSADSSPPASDSVARSLQAGAPRSGSGCPASSQAGAKSSLAWDLYFGLKIASLFVLWDESSSSCKAGVEGDAAFKEKAAMNAIRPGPPSASGTVALELTSDILLLSGNELTERLQALTRDARDLELTLLDGAAVGAGGIFPVAASGHMDVFKWHRKWELLMAQVSTRQCVVTLKGAHVCWPLLELFLAVNESAHKKLTWCPPDVVYIPGPRAILGMLRAMSVAQLRRFLLSGVDGLCSTDWCLLGGSPSSGAALPPAIKAPGLARRAPALPDSKDGTPLPPRGCSLLGYGLAVPGEEHRYTQEEVGRCLGIGAEAKGGHLFRKGHIETRYLAELGRDTADPCEVDLKRLHEKHLEWALAMLCEAILKACFDAGIEPSQVGHISICSSSGYLLPGLTAYALQAIGLPRHVSRQDIVGMGCHAGLNSFTSASSWAMCNPGKYALSCGVEVMSAQYVWGSRTRQQMNTLICNSLFGDGCFAAVLRAAPVDEASPPAAYLECPPAWWAHLCDTSALPDMVYEVESSEQKYAFLLSELAPFHVGMGIRTLMHIALEKGIPVHRAKHVVTHTGGKTVLNCTAPALGLEGAPGESLPWTVAALRDYGNQSSCSFMFAFHNLVKAGGVRAGDVGLFVTMGPGAGLEMALWTAGERLARGPA